MSSGAIRGGHRAYGCFEFLRLAVNAQVDSLDFSASVVPGTHARPERKLCRSVLTKRQESATKRLHDAHMRELCEVITFYDVIACVCSVERGLYSTPVADPGI